MNINIFGRPQSLLGKAGSIVVSASMIVTAFAPLAVSAEPIPPPPAFVTIDLINGEAPTGHCIAGPITIDGHGLTGSQGGPYQLDIGWGDGSATTTIAEGDPERTSGALFGKSEAFTFSVSHTPIGASTGITIFLHHSQESGADSNVIVVSQCVAPPTQGVVIVEKHVVNDDLGSAAASDFTLHINGNDFAGSETGTDFLLDPGTYAVTEDTLGGYTQTSLVCVGNDQTTTDGNVTVVAGENYVCTVTNDDTEPTTGTIRVIKHVVNDNGGTATAGDWTMDVTATNPSNTGFAGSESGVDVSVDPGSYSVDESGEPAGYAKSLGADCSGEIAVGETKTCTITNDDIAPTIKVFKTVTNDNGGTAVATSFSFLLDSLVSLIHNIAVATTAGAHTVSENPFFGYSPSSWAGDCAADGSITLTPGQNATCTITNDDNAPAPTPPSRGGGGSSDFGNPTFGPPGSVLGAATSTGQVLGESCGVYMGKHLRLGSKKNDVEQAKKLQAFLNKWMKSNLPITGFYGPMTEAVVRKFQAQYSDTVLSPWGISSPTGLVYLSTLRQVNLLECPELTLPIPNLVPWSQNPNAQ